MINNRLLNVVAPAVGSDARIANSPTSALPFQNPANKADSHWVLLHGGGQENV